MSAIESWSAQREALAVEALRGSGHLRLKVSGESMLPTLRPGDIAEIAACSLSDVGRGEIVLALRDGHFFLHRFMAADRGGFITRGDSMPAPDPTFLAGALLGRLVSVARNGRPVGLQLRPWSRITGLLCCHFGVVRRAVLKSRSRGRLQQQPIADSETA